MVFAGKKLLATDANLFHEGAFIMWTALGIISLLVILAALIGVVVGLIIGITRKSWKALKWSSIVLGVAFVLLIVVVIIDSGVEDSGDENAAATSQSPITSSEPTTIPAPPDTSQPIATPTLAPTATPQPTATPIPTATPVPRVSASELAQAYDANEVAAKAKYEEKIALITGEVRSITDARGKYDVKLLTGDVWTDIVCKVEISEVDSVIVLEKGQVVAVLGRIKGQGFADIVVDPCSIQK